MKKHEVDLQQFADILKYLRKINNTKLENIKWMDCGEEVKLSEEFIKEWKYVGLSNKEVPRAYGWLNKAGNITLK